MTSVPESQSTEDRDLVAFTNSLISQKVGGRYLVEKIIGTGGMGVVAAARHLELDQYVAVKFVRPEFANNSMVSARFVREAKVAAKVRGQHLVRVFDAGRMDSGVPFLVMEMLEGHALDDELKRRGQLPIDEVVDWLLQASAGLAELHGQNIVHRDLKPSNLFLAREAGSVVVKLLDFGISKEGDGGGGGLTGTTSIIGTPHYMSPEQIRAPKTVDTRSDIWALGAILYELLTGELPFVSFAETAGEIFGLVLFTDPVAPRRHRPQMPVELEEIILHCLRKNRDERFATVGELAQALAPFASSASAHRIAIVNRAMGPGQADGTGRSKRMDHALASTKLNEDGGSAQPIAITNPGLRRGEPESLELELATAHGRRGGVVASPATAAHWTADPTPPSKKSRVLPLSIAAVVLAGALGGGAFALTNQKTPELPTPAAAASAPIAPNASPSTPTTLEPLFAPPAFTPPSPTATASAHPAATAPVAKASPVGTPRTGSKPPVVGKGKTDDLLLDRK